ncbi:chromosome undetermined SCAF7914, whole genome shotgun sequence [Pseudomonas sp. St29]|nr:chromosome undetermined SCAF7914, whole genome shotgun sequence [Pseudomonas sp. St29]
MNVAPATPPGTCGAGGSVLVTCPVKVTDSLNDPPVQLFCPDPRLNSTAAACVPTAPTIKAMRDF